MASCFQRMNIVGSMAIDTHTYSLIHKTTTITLMHAPEVDDCIPISNGSNVCKIRDCKPVMIGVLICNNNCNVLQ